VLVFATTRIIFIPQGAFVTFGALSLAYFQLGYVPGIVWLLGGMAVCATVIELIRALRLGKLAGAWRIIIVNAGIPGVVIMAAVWLGPLQPPMPVQILLAIALVAPIGPMTYTIVFQALADLSSRALFVAAVATNLIFEGFGLFFFHAEGFRVEPILRSGFAIDQVSVKGQAIIVLTTAMLFMLLLFCLSNYTLLGKALRATAINPLGARFVGVSTAIVGKIAFTIAALMGAISGVMIGGLTTVYYDSGFLVGLKAFVGAICGGMASYPLAVVGALGVGLIESFGAFWSSAYKDAIVFSLLIPFLIWRSYQARSLREREEE